MTLHAHDIDFGPTPPTPPIDRDPWWPIRLTELPEQPPVKPTLGQLGDIGFVYPGKRHVFSGPPESAKTLIAYAVLIEVVRAGDTAVLIDFEMGGYDARGRLRELGATDQELNRILYLEPDEPATDQNITTLASMQPRLVVVDAALGAYSLQALDDSDRGDVEKLSRLYIAPFWRAGIATILIDHVVKDADQRGRYAIGSERKLGGADVHLGFDTITPISRGTSGLYKVSTHKDRGGWLKRGKLADIELISDPDTHRITWTLRHPATPTPGSEKPAYFRPTHVMEKTSRVLEALTEPKTRNDVVELVGHAKTTVLKALAVLVNEGYAEETEGPNRARPVRSLRPYREADDPFETPSGLVVPGGSAGGSEPPVSAVVPGGSRWFPEPGSVVVPGGSPPYGETPPEPNHRSEADDPGGSGDQPQLGWFADDGVFTASHLAYLDSIAPDPDPDE